MASQFGTRSLLVEYDKLMHTPLELSCPATTTGGPEEEEEENTTFEELYPDAEFYPTRETQGFQFAFDSPKKVKRYDKNQYLIYSHTQDRFFLVGPKQKVCRVNNDSRQVAQMVDLKQPRRIHRLKTMSDPEVMRVLHEQFGTLLPTDVTNLIGPKLDICDRLTEDGVKCSGKLFSSSSSSSNDQKEEVNCSYSCRSGNCPGWLGSILFHLPYTIAFATSVYPPPSMAMRYSTIIGEIIRYYVSLSIPSYLTETGEANDKITFTSPDQKHWYKVKNEGSEPGEGEKEISTEELVISLCRFIDPHNRPGQGRLDQSIILEISFVGLSLDPGAAGVVTREKPTRIFFDEKGEAHDFFLAADSEKFGHGMQYLQRRLLHKQLGLRPPSVFGDADDPFLTLRMVQTIPLETWRRND